MSRKQKRLKIALGETQIEQLNLRGNGGPDEIVFFDGKFGTYALDGYAVRALRTACVDETSVRVFVELEADNE